MKNIKNTIRNFDKAYITAGFLSMGSNHMAGIAIALLTSYFFANYLDKGVYGNYQFVLTILGVMAIFTLRGVGKQIVREYIQKSQIILVPKTVQFLLYALPVSTIGLASSLYFYLKDNPELAIALLIISIFFPLLNCLPLYSFLFLAKEAFKKQAILGVMQNTIPSVALIVVLWIGVGLTELILTYVISHTLTLLGLYIYTVKSERVPINTITLQSSTEVHLSLGQSILEIGKIADRLIVFSFLGASSFASYMIALLPVREMLRLPQIIRTLVLPKFSQYSYEQVRTQALEKTFFLFILFSVITGLYIILAPILFSIVFPVYPESILYTQLLSLILPLSSSLVLVQMLTVFDKTRELYIANITFTVLMVFLTTMFVMAFGILGVIYAKIAAGMARFFVLILFTMYSQ